MYIYILIGILILTAFASFYLYLRHVERMEQMRKRE